MSGALYDVPNGYVTRRAKRGSDVAGIAIGGAALLNIFRMTAGLWVRILEF